MDILLKQRLVGAIVLISLAVIFLPMLFTGTGKKEDQKFESSMPAEPAYEIKSPQISVPLSIPSKSLEKVPLSEPPAQDRQVHVPESAAAAIPKTSEPLQKPSANTKPSKPEDKPKPLATASPADTKAASDKTTGKPPSPEVVTTRPSTPAADMEPGAVTGWVVQVGSFSSKSNAEKLRNKLRKMGMASFVITGVSNNKKVYRVRVGPEIDRAEAENIQTKIKEKTKLSGLVMKYP